MAKTVKYKATYYGRFVPAIPAVSTSSGTQGITINVDFGSAAPKRKIGFNVPKKRRRNG